ncbi:MAG: hypothetical protein WAK33_19960 [Silvibacterium sp.]
MLDTLQTDRNIELTLKIDALFQFPNILELEPRQIRMAQSGALSGDALTTLIPA